MGDLLQLRDAHEQAQMLLPWRVNGTLEPGEDAWLDAHLAECAECRHDLAANRTLRELYADTVVTGEPARSRILGVIESRPDGSSWGFIRRRLSSGWGRAAQVAVAAAAAVALAVVIAPADRDEDGYGLLGSERAEPVGNAIVLFSPDTAERDLRAALEQAGARLVDGPTASGAYIVQVPDARRAEALDGLRALPQVMLAEPIDAADEP